jgi:hypothetical protein
MTKTIQKKSESGMRKAQFTMPISLHKRFKKVAIDEETTMSKIVVDLVVAYVEEREKESLK